MMEQLTLLKNDYLEKLYFFALKKTGNKHAAEDLAQDIVVEVIRSLANGCQPQNFAYWLWGVARNCYAKWVEKDKRQSILISPETIGITSAEDSTETIEDLFIYLESINLLRRELSLLSSYYREITVAYYIFGEKIAQIAQKMNMPEGTVKRRLYESRKNLKEGMQMAREKGQRSFIAENVSFSKSGRDGRDGSPWKLIQRRIPKNILLAAYRNPLTLEEFCLEMGIAMPYMEEEVKLLADGTLLKELDNGRYETDFLIVDSTMQVDIFQKLVEASSEFSPKLIALLDQTLDLPEPNFYGNRMEASTLYWTLIPMLVDILVDHVGEQEGVSSSLTPRPHDGSWDITGSEECELPFSLSISHNGSGGTSEVIWTYKIRMRNLWDRAGELSSHEVSVLASAIRSQRNLDQFGDVEREIIVKLANRGFVQLYGQTIKPTFIVITPAQMDDWKERLRIEPLYEQLRKIMRNHYRYTYSRISKDPPKRLVNQLQFVAQGFQYNFRMMSLRYALDAGRVTIPKEIDKSTIAMHMLIS